MKNNGMILLRALLLSTSKRNIYRYSGDKKKRRNVIASAIGHVLLFAMLMAFCIIMCIGYGKVGLIGAAPVLCALLISGIAFIFTLIKTNGYLFHFKEYDMLMSLPFEARTVAACKFLYMYLNSLPWYAGISLAMLIGYGIYARPGILVYPVWIILTFFLPVLPMLVAAFLGFLIARISAGFRKSNIVQTVLTFILLLFGFSLRFIISGMAKNNEIMETLRKASTITDNAAGIYRPAKWFADSITEGSLLSFLLLVGVSTILFILVFSIVGHSYLKINSALKSHAAAKSYRMKEQRQRSVLQAIVFKEFKRLTGSTVYMTNGTFGMLLSVLLGIITLIIGFNRIIGIVTQGAPIDPSILQPAIPFIIYFFIGMVATTACSPSLEGKNYWILQSLPITKKTIYQGKMLFNMLLTVPFMVFATLCLCISAGVPLLNSILYLILGFALCSFSTTWGCVCGVRHMRLDWENEVEVIKQGAAVTIYLLPNMFVVMGLTVLVVYLGTFMDHRLLALIFILIATVLAALSYRRVMILSKEVEKTG